MFYLKNYQIVGDEIKSDFSVNELLQLMNDYCQVDFGYPNNETEYQHCLVQVKIVMNILNNVHWF